MHLKNQKTIIRLFFFDFSKSCQLHPQMSRSGVAYRGLCHTGVNLLPDLRLRLKRVRRGWATHFFRGLGHTSSGRATSLECSQSSSVLTSSTVKNSWGAVGLASVAAVMSEWLRDGGGVAKVVPADVGGERQVKPVLKQVWLILLAHITWQLVPLLFETTWMNVGTIPSGMACQLLACHVTSPPLWQKEPTF